MSLPDSNSSSRNANSFNYDNSVIISSNSGKKDNRFIRGLKENPLVVVGLTVTIGALVASAAAFQRGDSAKMQKMMRLRVGAQGFTVVAILVPTLYYSFYGGSVRSNGGDASSNGGSE
ncbi:662_t:CDS:2 [Entrophospora sp. SA101]|nr:6845_t:CDS:2 [Entrophospora candida]CAH1759922.1 14146_t:CDS:2 [Entrophospora sp. SA101]CAJ0825934.1 662_t:CDS:2 [Entrophospora sp. SA101]CAJ0902171.1 3246_t:CDS:2 [Entrophospora sp. SA101]